VASGPWVSTFAAGIGRTRPFIFRVRIIRQRSLLCTGIAAVDLRVLAILPSARRTEQLSSGASPYAPRAARLVPQSPRTSCRAAFQCRGGLTAALLSDAARSKRLSSPTALDQ
jgi:hypothetical protein